MDKNDRMPSIDSSLYDKLKQRALRLSHAEICELLELSGIVFESRFKNGEPAGLSELLEFSKEELLEPLDEAKSRRQVEQFLDAKGV